MIRLKNVFIALAALAMLAACGGGKDEKPLDITGEWNLVSIQTKSATLGGQAVDVYILFASDRSFTMYQKIGAGRYYKYSGTYVLDGATLSGKYSDGKLWGSSYEVELSSSDSQMTLTSASGEVDTYKKASIPSDVVENSLISK